MANPLGTSSFGANSLAANSLVANTFVANTFVANFRDSAFYRVYWWLTSVKLTVVLLSIILVTLIAGTIFEANRGTKAAQFLFYNSHWFDALLIFFGFNLICCTIRRFKRKLSQLGFMTTHVGVMTILIGGLMSRNFKQEGQLIIPEGEARDYLLLDQSVLTVTVDGGNGPSKPIAPIVRQYDTHYDRLGGRTDVRSNFRVPEAGIDLVVDQFYPDLRVEQTLEDTNPEPNPALDLRVLDWTGEHSQVLLARDATRREAKTETASFRFVEAVDMETLERELGKPGFATTLRFGVVEVVLASGERYEIPVDGGLERPFTATGSRGSRPVPPRPAAARSVPSRPAPSPPALAASGVTLTVEGFFPDFALVGDEYSSRSTTLANPAVFLDVTGTGDSHERHLLFADHPDVDVSHRQGEKLTEKVIYRLPDRSTGARGQVKLVRGPDGDIHYVTGGGGTAERRGLLRPGQAVSYPEAGVRFWVTKALSNARFAEKISNGGREIKNPALHIIARDGRDEQASWVIQGSPHELTLGDRRLTLDYNFRRLDIGFSVMLEDFREITYPGITMAESFESDVVVSAPDRRFSRQISMNNPLKFRGYKIFQSSFQRGERETSIFSVARDPGVPVVYTGFLIFITGLIVIFFLKPYLIRWSAQRARASGRASGGAPMTMAAAAARAGGMSIAAMAVPSEKGVEGRVE